jgi:tRNA U34 5-carboxymethylaminomethyl modifying GTPase MnmE/TrmE
MEIISRISEIDPTNKNIAKIIVFDEGMSNKDFSVLVNEFDYGKEMVDKSVGIYRNVGIVLSLAKKDEGLAEWKTYLDRFFPKKKVVTKLDNVFLSKNYDKLLLITNRRLVTVDVKKINEKIRKMNYEIDVYNDSVSQEITPERKGFMDVMKKIFS